MAHDALDFLLQRKTTPRGTKPGDPGQFVLQEPPTLSRTLISAHYPRGWLKRRVTASGYIRWRRRLRVIGRAFGGQDVGFKPTAPGTHEVYFERHLIGLLVDTDPGGLRPAQ